MSHKLLSLAVLAMLAVQPCQAASNDTGIFDQLQQNVWYLPTADKAARLYVTSIGKGTPVVFLHGGPGNDFNYFVDALAPHTNRYKFILFDQRGSLLSPVPDAQVKNITLAKLVDDLETLRVATGQDKMILLGHSFGSYLALAYFIAHPDRVAGMVLTGAFPPNAKLMDLIRAIRPRQETLQSRPLIAQVLRAEGLPADPSRDTPEQSSVRWRIAHFAPDNVIHLERWRQVEGGEVYYNEKVDDAVGDTLPASMDIRATLAAHPIPIEIIQGDQDYVDPGASLWQPLAQNDKNVVIRVLPQAGHYSWIDQPVLFARDLDEGLARMR